MNTVNDTIPKKSLSWMAKIDMPNEMTRQEAIACIKWYKKTMNWCEERTQKAIRLLEDTLP